MITAAAKAACDVARYVTDDDVTVTRLLEIMNHAIFESAQRRFVMTCFASIIDTEGAHDHVRQRRPQLPVPVPRRRGQRASSAR